MNWIKIEDGAVIPVGIQLILCMSNEKGVRLNCLDLGIEICINIHRTQIDNRTVALKLFDQLLDTL